MRAETLDTIHRLYRTPQCVHIAKKKYQTVKIYIRDATGNPVPFDFGKAVATLHCHHSRNIMRKLFCCEASHALHEDYYTRKSEGDLPVHYGSHEQRGYGIGSILSWLFRKPSSSSTVSQKICAAGAEHCNGHD